MYQQLLADPDPQVRMTSAYILGSFSREVPEIKKDISDHLLTEEDPKVRASLILSLGMLPEPGPIWFQRMEAVITEEGDPLVKLAATIALTFLGKQETPDSAVAILIKTLAHPEQLSVSYRTLPFADSDIVGDVSHIVLLLGRERAKAAIPALLQNLAAPHRDADRKEYQLYRAMSSLEVASTLLYLLFDPLEDEGDEENKRMITPQELTPEQHQGIIAMAESETLWIFGGNTGNILRAFGLPGNQDKLKEFLDQVEPL